MPDQQQMFGYNAMFSGVTFRSIMLEFSNIIHLALTFSLYIYTHTHIYIYIYIYIYIHIYRKSASRFSRGTVLNTLKQSRIYIYIYMLVLFF